MPKNVMKTVTITIAAVLGLMLLGVTIFVYSGVYNVAASSKDSAVMHWLLSTTREVSVEHEAKSVTLPPENVMTSPETIRIGLVHYKEMCIVCHGAPGVEPGEARAGLNPKPPLLAKRHNDMSIRETFWVIKHGIKMTGMPAWGATHDDDKIWAMVAFVNKLPQISPDEYQTMQQQLAETGHQDEHHHH